MPLQSDSVIAEVEIWHQLPCGWHPMLKPATSPYPAFFASAKQIVPTDNMWPKSNDAIWHHRLLKGSANNESGQCSTSCSAVFPSSLHTTILVYSTKTYVTLSQSCGYMLRVPLSLLLDYVFSSVDEHILIHIHMIRNLVLKRKQNCCVSTRKKFTLRHSRSIQH